MCSPRICKSLWMLKKLWTLQGNILKVPWDYSTGSSSRKRYSPPFITSTLIDKWRQTLTNYSYKTICDEYSILAQFIKYMNNIGFTYYVPRIPKNKVNTYIPYIFTHKQIRSIFNMCDSVLASDHGSMDSRLFSILIIFHLLYDTGMRVSEATSLLNQDINLKKKSNHNKENPKTAPTLDTCLSVILPGVKSICRSKGQATFVPCRHHGVPVFISPSGLPLTKVEFIRGGLY